ncbi:hypothetical protein C2845_PM13G07220 [Panicum miliaceum]|uniref:Cytochrome P450 n=1 Tax=Panicum miliaceum TaxID=4540 RepID=A0A3L6RM74_PANMI|nr:hypothetical protein C2845_PM13G07220 [Panicum miliaceum]
MDLNSPFHGRPNRISTQAQATGQPPWQGFPPLSDLPEQHVAVGPPPHHHRGFHDRQTRTNLLCNDPEAGGLVAFGGGARACPGNDFARVETLVAMHYIVTRFRWKLAAGCDGGFSRSPLPYPSQGLLIDVQPVATPVAGN